MPHWGPPPPPPVGPQPPLRAQQMGNRLRSQRSRIEHSTPQPSSHPGQVSYCSHTQSTAGPAFPLPGRLRPAPAESRMRQLLGIPQRGERGERVRVEEAPGTCPPAALTWSRWGRRMEGGGGKAWQAQEAQGTSLSFGRGWAAPAAPSQWYPTASAGAVIITPLPLPPSTQAAHQGCYLNLWHRVGEHSQVGFSQTPPSPSQQSHTRESAAVLMVRLASGLCLSATGCPAGSHCLT